jgi:chitodextrinase
MKTFRKGLGVATSLMLIPAFIAVFPLGAGASAASGTIEVVTDPAGAAVFVDGEARGVTPVSVPDVPAGTHRVSVVKDGFVENSRVVSVAAGRSENVDVRLTQAPAPDPDPQPVGDGWSTRKKAVVGAGAAAVLIGGIALLGGGSSEADDQPPVAGTVAVSPQGVGLAGVTNFSFTSQGASDPENAPLTYSWTFGDGGTGTGATVAHVFNSGGTFTVTLTVSDGTNQVTAATRSVQAEDIGSGFWVNFEPAVGGARIRRVQFVRSGAQLSGSYRTNLSPAGGGTVTGSMSSPRNLQFEARLQDPDLGQVGFSFEGAFNNDFTAFEGLAQGYLLGDRGRTLVFGKQQ